MTKKSKETVPIALCLLAFFLGLHQVHQERSSNYTPSAAVQSSVEEAAKKFEKER
jgi:hypothetical protein